MAQLTAKPVVGNGTQKAAIGQSIIEQCEAACPRKVHRVAIVIRHAGLVPHFAAAIDTLDVREHCAIWGVVVNPPF